MLLSIWLWVAVTPFAFAKVLHEQLATVPSGWTKMSTPSDESIITLQIALLQQNVEEFEAKLLAASTPGSASYGHYLEGDAVKALLKPSAGSEDAVLNWLDEFDITDFQSDGEWVDFSTTISKANRLLSTTFHNFENGEGVTKLRTTEYSVGADVASHIDFISPTTYFGAIRPGAPLPAVVPSERRKKPVERRLDASCADLITPNCLKKLYNINNYTADANYGSSIGFGSFLNQSARSIDLSLFEAQQGLAQQQFSLELINNATDNQTIGAAHFEANLDVQYIVGISQPLPVSSYITGGSPPFIPNLDQPTTADNNNEPYLPYYRYLLAKDNSELPYVITNSYDDDEQTVPIAYAKRVCNMIGQLGLRGISVLESSGDTGVGAACQSNDGLETPQFTPQFPGACPWLTSVGGTQSISPEVAWEFGSGGFSNYFTQPSYQFQAVQDYLTNYINASTLSYYSAFTNVSNRGFPDVAAHSLSPNYCVVVDNTTAESGGTSASAPVFAATIALLNDARFKVGKGPLGFLNPWLYSEGFKGLTDITGGGSVGCNGVNSQTGATLQGGVIPFASWNATVGWDPVTGLGVPDFEKLKALVLEL